MNLRGIFQVSMIVVAASAQINGSKKSTIKNISLIEVDDRYYVRWNPLPKVVDRNSTTFYTLFSKCNGSFKSNTTSTNISIPFSIVNVANKCNFTVTARIDNRVVAKGSEIYDGIKPQKYQIQKINNISVSNVDFEYFLRWNPILIPDDKIDKAVEYRILVKYSDKYNFKTTDTTTVKFIPEYMDELSSWIFTITASIGGQVMARGESHEFRGLFPEMGVPASFSAPQSNFSNECGNTTVTVSLERRFPDMGSNSLIFHVQYFYDNLLVPFDEVEKEAAYNSDTVTVYLYASSVRNICVVARYKVRLIDASSDESASSQRTCVRQCGETKDPGSDYSHERNALLPVYYKVLIGVAVIATMTILVLLLINAKKHVWNPWKGKAAGLPQTTKQVIEWNSDDMTFSKDCDEGELLSKIGLADEADTSSPTLLLSFDECKITRESAIPKSSKKSACVSRNAGDHIENPAYKMISDVNPSKIMSEKSEGVLDQGGKGSVDSAFSDYIALQACLSSQIITSVTTNVYTFSDHESVDEGYVKFPDEKQ